jgi:hypothetical protein
MIRRAGVSSRTRETRLVTWAGIAWPSVSQSTMSSAPSARASRAMASTRSSGTGPSNGQVNDVAMQSWIRPPAARAVSTAAGMASRLASVLRPMLAWLCASEAEKQYWTLSAPAATARSTCRGVATQTQHLTSSSGLRASTTSRVLAIGGTRSGRAIEPISRLGTPSRSSSRTISTFRSVDSSLPVSCSPSRRVTSRRMTSSDLAPVMTAPLPR